MLEALAWLQRLRRGWRTDWVFVGFLVVAAGGFLQHGRVERAKRARQVRIDEAFVRLVTATGAANAAGAASALEDLRAETPSEDQQQLGQALIEASASPQRAYAPYAPDTEGSAVLRGARLALEGDLAAARSSEAIAQERYTRAAGVLGEDALRTRQERLAARTRDSSERAAETLRQVSDEIEGLFASAREVGASSTYYRRRQMVSMLGQRLPEDKQRALQEVLGAIDRGHQAADTSRPDLAFEGPAPAPPAPLSERDAQDPRKQRAYDELVASYQRRAAERARRDAELAQRQLGASAARRDAERYLGDARALYQRSFVTPAP